MTSMAESFEQAGEKFDKLSEEADRTADGIKRVLLSDLSDPLRQEYIDTMGSGVSEAEQAAGLKKMRDKILQRIKKMDENPNEPHKDGQPHAHMPTYLLFAETHLHDLIQELTNKFAFEVQRDLMRTLADAYRQPGQ
ncbi:MAG: hypothetical protein AAFO17_16945 [Pseudomonadota bacterium]